MVYLHTFRQSGYDSEGLNLVLSSEPAFLKGLKCSTQFNFANDEMELITYRAALGKNTENQKLL